MKINKPPEYYTFGGATPPAAAIAASGREGPCGGVDAFLLQRFITFTLPITLTQLITSALPEFSFNGSITHISSPTMSSNGAQRLKNRKPIPKPVPAYLPQPGSALAVDKAVYTSIREAPRELIEEFTLPIRSGKAWRAPAGSIVRISTPEGPQVGMHFLKGWR